MTDNPRRVYLATSGEYSSYRVLHVFAREEDARAYEAADDVEEYELHDGPVDVRRWHTLHWFSWQPDGPGNPLELNTLLDFDDRRGNAGHHWGSTLDPEKLTLTVTGWDLDGVRKVYSEQRAKYLAEQAGL